MQQTVDAAVEDVKSNFQDLDGSVQTLLESFSISEEQISDRLAGKVNIKQVNSVLDFFSMQEGPLARFEDFGDYNPCVAKPIVVVDDKRYLFLASSLCKATYESPFYPMIGDSEYKNTHSEHRGRFTEKFVYDRLCTVFGPDYVYKNIKLYHGNDVSDEIDVMAVVADRAILVQCKSKLMTQQAQQGDLIKAKKDFNENAGKAYRQNVGCARDLLDTTRIAKDQDGQIIDVPRDYSHLYPITVMADSYPSLNIQAHEFLKQSKVQDVPSVLEQPYFTDVFFIDILSELLSEPLMFIDYLDQRCRYDNSTCLLTEKGMLANYFINDFDFSSNAVKFAAPDELYYNVPEKIERINTIYELSGELES